MPAAAPPWAPYERVWLAYPRADRWPAIGQTGFQGDNYYRPVTFSAPSLGNVPCQTTGACLGQPWPPDLLQLTYAAAGGPLGSRPGACPGRPMACHLATGSRDLGLPRDRASA